MSISGARKSVFGPGDDQDVGVGRHVCLLREHELVDDEVVGRSSAAAIAL